MNIAPPAPAGPLPTAALGCVGAEISPALLSAVVRAGAVPVMKHRLASEPGSAHAGPREMLETSIRAMEKAGGVAAWGAGCAASTVEEASLFATAGFTWFTLELSPLIDDRAGAMSLDELDAAIVSLEDSGCFAEGWHQAFLDREWTAHSGRALSIDDTTLGRAAAKFGRALAHADQIHQAIRTLWSGRCAAPDLELDFSAHRIAATDEEFLFLAIESARRGLAPSSIAVSFGGALQPGADAADARAVEERIARLADIASVCGSLRAGVRFANGIPDPLSIFARLPGGRVHLDLEEAACLAALGKLAESQPTLFRQWLAAAQELFPFVTDGVPLSISEEDIHFLPDVPDASLRETFLGQSQGRQLLLSTFPEVLRKHPLLRSAITSP